MYASHCVIVCPESQTSGQQASLNTTNNRVNIKTGETAVGYKMRGDGDGFCAEDEVVRLLGGNAEDIVFSRAYRPRIGEYQDICTRCQTKYQPEQFAPGTTFKRQ